MSIIRIASSFLFKDENIPRWVTFLGHVSHWKWPKTFASYIKDREEITLMDPWSKTPIYYWMKSCFKIQPISHRSMGFPTFTKFCFQFMIVYTSYPQMIKALWLDSTDWFLNSYIMHCWQHVIKVSNIQKSITMQNQTYIDGTKERWMRNLYYFRLCQLQCKNSCHKCRDRSCNWCSNETLPCFLRR